MVQVDDASDGADPVRARLRGVGRRQTVDPAIHKISASFTAHDWRAQVGVVILAATMFAASAILVPGGRGLLGGVLAVLMVAVVLTDARFFIIPDLLSGAACVLGVLHASVQNPESAPDAIMIAILRGAIVAAAFGALRLSYRLWRGREGMGLGDVKLAGVVGVWLDWPTIPIAIEIAALSALAAYGFRQWVLRRPFHPTAKLPFGVFFAPAIWLGWLIESAL